MKALRLKPVYVCLLNKELTTMRRKEELQAEQLRIKARLAQGTRFHQLIGKSKPMQLVYQQIQAISRLDIPLIIEGEAGTGKELVARTLHAASHRRDMPFISLNCTGQTEPLLSSQLFGHKKSTFPEAVSDHHGLFEAAAGGTLYLAEIGEIPTNIQLALLHALREQEIIRLGETSPRKVDVRLIAGTRHNLSKAVASGQFRADLIYHLCIAHIGLPPLRERREDILLLSNAFLKRLADKPDLKLSSGALGRLMDHDWPGNVQQLENTIELASARCQDGIIHLRDLPLEVTAHTVSQPEFAVTGNTITRGGPIGEGERRRILNALAQTHGNRKEAARLLGISRATLYRRLNRLNIELPR